MENDKIIFHIDVNSAFLSWSAVRLLRNGHTKDIRTIPCIIGGDKEKNIYNKIYNNCNCDITEFKNGIDYLCSGNCAINDFCA